MEKRISLSRVARKKREKGQGMRGVSSGGLAEMSPSAKI